MTEGKLFERYNQSFVARIERVALHEIASRLPAFVTPDRLTAFGVFGAVVIFIGYVMSHHGPQWLWLANLGLVLHWLGDSLDGTVARLRRIERPRYGYFLDQNVDVLTNLIIALGAGLSPWLRLDTALLALTGYHMVSIHTFVRNVVSHRFHIDIRGLGPTEMRLGIVAMNLGILGFGVQPITFQGLVFTWCDVLAALLALGLAILFAVEVAREARLLRKADEAALLAHRK